MVDDNFFILLLFAAKVAAIIFKTEKWVLSITTLVSNSRSRFYRICPIGLSSLDHRFEQSVAIDHLRGGYKIIANAFVLLCQKSDS